ncbi:MAG TPA: formate dehydrogenase subunit gamma [Ramlibacter sp.]|nr:formate dehydrogenase subunit gamma [Ramlibacter sp.]
MTEQGPARTLRGLLLAAAAFLAWPAGAAVPHRDAAPAYAEEQTILQQEKDGPEPGWGSLRSGRNHFERNYLGAGIGRDSEQDLILQRGGNTWRVLRNGPISVVSGIILLLVPLVLLGVWRFVGPARIGEAETGRRVQRFTAWQRLVHWATAISFLVLAVSGLLILFGKKLLIPLIGHAAFSWIAIASKYLHNIVGPLFIACSVLMFIAFVRRNFFRRADWEWVRRGGGLLSHEHVPAGYFNAGEKAWFWGGVVLLGLVMSASGLVLDFVNFQPTRYLIQWANYLHLGGATLYIAFALGHIYLGTLGTPGAYEGMRHGTVDEAWARAHHRRWYDELKGRGAGPA